MATATSIRDDIPREVIRLVETVIEVTPDIKAVLAQDRGASGKINASGDTQRIADDKIDDILFEAISPLEGFGEFLSEEREDLVDIGDGLSIATDPLDGSSNIKTNTTVGTIIGVYDAPLPAKGREIVASIFVVLGPLTTVGVAANDELIEYVIQDGEVVAEEPLSIPEDGGIWSFSGQPNEWTPALRSFDTTLSQRFDHRYTGAMIADVRLLLAKGGLVGYPERSTKPDGVLRLQYESNPIAHAIEAAGGAGSTGHGRILDREPDGLHERVPTFFGTRSLIDELETQLEAQTHT